MADNTVRCTVFAEIHIQIRDPGDRFCKVGFQAVQISCFCQCGDLIQLVAHIVPRLPGFFNGGFQAFIALLLHGKQLVFLLQSRIPVKAGCHQQKDRIEHEQQKQKRDAHNDVDLQDPPCPERYLVARGYKKVQQDEHQRQYPEHIPRLRKIVILHHRAYCVGGGIIGCGSDQPADRIIKDAGAKAEPRLVRRQLHPDHDCRADGPGQAVQARKYRADRKRDGSGFPEREPQRFEIQENCHNRYEQQGERGRETEMIAKQPAAKAKPEQQRHRPCCKLCGRQLQIGTYRKIRKQQTGKHDRKFQNRAQNVLQSARPLCSRNSIKACRAAFKSS